MRAAIHRASGLSEPARHSRHCKSERRPNTHLASPSGF